MHESATTSAPSRCHAAQFRAAIEQRVRRRARSTTPIASATTSSQDASRASGLWITSLRNPAPPPISAGERIEPRALEARMVAHREEHAERHQEEQRRVAGVLDGAAGVGRRDRQRHEQQQARQHEQDEKVKQTTGHTSVYFAHEHPTHGNRGAHHRRAHRKADHHARPVPALAQCADKRMQSEEQPGTFHAARRTHREVRGRRTRATSHGRGEIGIWQPGAQVSADLLQHRVRQPQVHTAGNRDRVRTAVAWTADAR